VRFELTFFALNPKLAVVAPWREWDIKGREDAIEYAKNHNIPVKATKEKSYSQDRNVWHISHEVNLLCTEITILENTNSSVLLLIFSYGLVDCLVEAFVCIRRITFA
jgi:argininosuccinate synthase